MDGVFAANDSMAAGALRVLRGAGREVPRDVAIAGFDDLDIAQIVEPSPTTVHQPVQALGHEMARLPIGLIRRRGTQSADPAHPPDPTLQHPTSTYRRGNGHRGELVTRRHGVPPRRRPAREAGPLPDSPLSAVRTSTPARHPMHQGQRAWLPGRLSHETTRSRRLTCGFNLSPPSVWTAVQAATYKCIPCRKACPTILEDPSHDT